MSRASLVLCALVCLHIRSSPAAEMDQHQKDMKEHYEHLAYIAEFKCHTPQPRVIPVHQLIANLETNGKAYFPDVTVLHRCDFSSGCCISNHYCNPVHSHQVQLAFKVTYLENSDLHKKGSWSIEYHEMTNHTECTCVAGNGYNVGDKTTSTEPPTSSTINYERPKEEDSKNQEQNTDYSTQQFYQQIDVSVPPKDFEQKGDSPPETAENFDQEWEPIPKFTQKPTFDDLDVKELTTSEDLELEVESLPTPERNSPSSFTKKVQQR